MTDQTIPADPVREIIAIHRAGASEPEKLILDALEDLLPPLPTLADMSGDERAEYQWAQADTESWGRVIILLPNESAGTVILLDQEKNVIYEDPAHVTPRPELPRLTWPGTEKVEDVIPMKVGDVIESADDPRIDALPEGSVLLDCDEVSVTKVRTVKWGGLGYVPVKSTGTKWGPWTVSSIGPKEN